MLGDRGGKSFIYELGGMFDHFSKSMRAFFGVSFLGAPTYWVTMENQSDMDKFRLITEGECWNLFLEFSNYARYIGNIDLRSIRYLYF